MEETGSNKGKWIAGVFIFILYVNIGILYWLIIGARSSVIKLESSLSNSNTKKAQETTTKLETVAVVETEEKEEAKTCSLSCKKEIDNLKEVIAKITPQIIKEVEKIRTVTTNASSIKEYSISFGSGQTNSEDWEDVPGLNAYIDSNNYNSISAVYFEATLRIPTGNGQAYARLYNKTDNHPVWFSDLSTESDQPTLLQSPQSISLDSGNKLYQVQMKTSLKFDSLVDSARIKIILK
jgi:hypothetical protein